MKALHATAITIAAPIVLFGLAIGLLAVGAVILGEAALDRCKGGAS